MALSLNSTFVQAAAMGISEPRFLVELYVDASTSYKFLSGKCTSSSMGSYPESILTLEPVTRTLDWKTREVSTNQVSISFVRDELWNTLLNDYAIKGGYVDVKLGFSEIAEASYEQHAVLLVSSVRETETEIGLVCKTVENKLMGTEIFWQWVSLHPLQCARRILTIAGIPNSRQDLTSLAPSSYTSDISHFVVSRAHTGGLFGSGEITATNGLTKPTKASDLLSDIGRILGGSFGSDENGDVRFTKFDPSSAVADTWTTDDLFEVVVEPLYENLVNKVTVNSHPYVMGSGAAYAYEFSDEDATSQSDYAIVVPGGTDEDNVQELPLETDWISGVAQLYSDMTSSVPGVGQQFVVQGYSVHGFCGTAWGNISHGTWYSNSGYGSGSQNSEHQVSSGRPLYVRIGQEIIKCSAVTFLDDANIHIYDEANSTNRWRYIRSPHSLSLVVAERGWGTSSAAAHTGVESSDDPDLVFDVTIQQWVSDLLVTRLKDGGQAIRCCTGLHKYGIEVGDLVSLTLPAARYRAKGRAGLSSTTKFEVTEKALDLFASSPCIRWTLVEAAWSGASSHTGSVDVRFQAIGSTTEQYEAAANVDFARPHVYSGLDVASTSTLDVTFNTGIASNGMTSARVKEQITHTVTASKDTYFAVDTKTGSVSAYEVANSAAQPTKAPQEAWMALVVSDGSGITSTTDIRSKTALSGVKVIDETVGPMKTLAENVGRNHNFDFNAWSRGGDYPPDGWDVK